jgi:glycosyltransferase involved in cell wall biosynthesis
MVGGLNTCFKLMNKRVLFVCLHRPDRSPSQRFRFEQYIGYLEANGYSCYQSYLLNAKEDKAFYQAGNYARKAFILAKSTFKRLRETFFGKYDLVFVQRECYLLGTSYFESKFGQKSKMIFDFDDSIWMHQTGEVKSANKALYFLKNPSKTKDIIQASDMVFAGNNYLAEYARQYNDNVRVVPTTIDTEEYQRIPINKSKEGAICIGWSGSFSTIIHFQYLLPALENLKEKYGDRIYFKVIGDGSYRNEKLGIAGLPWIKETETKDLSEIDIGVMPLPDDKWTEGKCGLKGLQYMALRIPTLMSPVGVNKDIIREGENGFLAHEMKEWVYKISLLVEDELLRKKIGDAGRKTVVDHYSVTANKEFYLKYFNELTGVN